MQSDMKSSTLLMWGIIIVTEVWNMVRANHNHNLKILHKNLLASRLQPTIQQVLVENYESINQSIDSWSVIMIKSNKHTAYNKNKIQRRNIADL